MGVFGQAVNQVNAQNMAAQGKTSYGQKISTPKGGYSTNQLKDINPKGYNKYRMSNFTPAQTELFDEMFGHVSPDSYTARLARGDKQLFEEQEKPALQQFNQLQGSISSRFSGQGMGARNSSGFQNTQNAAAQDFAGQLQANRQNLQRQAVQDLMGMSSSLLSQQPYTQGYFQKQQKDPQAQENSQKGWGMAGGIVGGAIGTYFGNPMAGYALGSAGGNMIGSYT